MGFVCRAWRLTNLGPLYKYNSHIINELLKYKAPDKRKCPINHIFSAVCSISNLRGNDLENEQTQTDVEFSFHMAC